MYKCASTLGFSSFMLKLPNVSFRKPTTDIWKVFPDWTRPIGYKPEDDNEEYLGPEHNSREISLHLSGLLPSPKEDDHYAPAAQRMTVSFKA